MTTKSMFQSTLALGLLLGGVAMTRVALACPSCPAGQSVHGAGQTTSPMDGNWHELYQNRAMIEGGSGPYGTILFVDLTNGIWALLRKQGWPIMRHDAGA